MLDEASHEKLVMLSCRSLAAKHLSIKPIRPFAASPATQATCLACGCAGERQAEEQRLRVTYADKFTSIER